jgi:predicted transcriptional regulator
MSEQQRDDSGEFTAKVSNQDVLKAFDTADAPVLTANELAEELSLSRSAMNHRLNRMRDDGLVERKQTGARAVAWWATVAPAPSAETLRDIEATEGELERGETVNQAAMKQRLGMDG